MSIFPVPQIEVHGQAQPIAGSPGALRMVEVASLCVDLTYQRNMTILSVRLAGKIAAHFDWRRFVPAVGVEVGDGRIALVDGQHRCAAAKARGVEKVPVYVLNCSTAEAAGAFAAINGDVTPMSPIDVYRALLVAGDQDSLTLQQTLDVAGVKIVDFKSGFKKGETRSISVLRRAMRVYGRELLITALQCLTETGGGNPGCINGAAVNGIALALISKPDLLATPSRLFEIMDGVDVRAILAASEIEFAQTKKPRQGIFTREINRAIATAGRAK